MERLVSCRILAVDEQNGAQDGGHAQQLEGGDLLPVEEDAQGGGHKGLDGGQDGCPAGLGLAQAVGIEHIGHRAAQYPNAQGPHPGLPAGETGQIPVEAGNRQGEKGAKEEGVEADGGGGVLLQGKFAEDGVKRIAEAGPQAKENGRREPAASPE